MEKQIEIMKMIKAFNDSCHKPSDDDMREAWKTAKKESIDAVLYYYWISSLGECTITCATAVSVWQVEMQERWGDES